MLNYRKGILVVLAILIVGTLSVQSRPKPHPQNKGSHFTAQQTPAQPTPPAQNLSPEQITKAIADGINAATKEYDARHSSPQPDNSVWYFNLFLMIFTGGLVVVGAVQCYLIFWTLEATQIAANVAQSALTKLERPYVFNINPTFLRTETEIHVSINVANCGKMTGNIIEINGQFFSGDVLPAEPPYDQGRTISADITAIPIEMAQPPFINPYILLGNYKSENLKEKYFFGYFIYDGLIEKGHKSWFCYATPEDGSGLGTSAGGAIYNGYK